MDIRQVHLIIIIVFVPMCTETAPIIRDVFKEMAFATIESNELQEIKCIFFTLISIFR